MLPKGSPKCTYHIIDRIKHDLGFLKEVSNLLDRLSLLFGLLWALSSKFRRRPRRRQQQRKGRASVAFGKVRELTTDSEGSLQCEEVIAKKEEEAKLHFLQKEPFFLSRSDRKKTVKKPFFRTKLLCQKLEGQILPSADGWTASDK